jgi:hypothetical protein
LHQLDSQVLDRPIARVGIEKVPRQFVWSLAAPHRIGLFVGGRPTGGFVVRNVEVPGDERR